MRAFFVGGRDVSTPGKCMLGRAFSGDSTRAVSDSTVFSALKKDFFVVAGGVGAVFVDEDDDNDDVFRGLPLAFACSLAKRSRKDSLRAMVQQSSSKTSRAMSPSPGVWRPRT